MRPFALLALMAATAYADGHETKPKPDEASTFTIDTIMQASYSEEFEGMNTAQIIIKATDDVIEALMNEPIDSSGLEALRTFRGVRLREVLHMFCEGGDGEGDNDKDKGRRLDGHEMTTMDVAPTNSTIAVVDEDGKEGEMVTICLRAFRLLDQIEEYKDEDTTEERKVEITQTWSDILDGIDFFESDGATVTFAASVTGLATAITLLAF